MDGWPDALQLSGVQVLIPNKVFHSLLIAVTLTDGVKLEIGVAIIFGESMDDMRALVVGATAAVSLCEFS